MNPTGTLHDDGRTLTLTRRFAAPIDEVWACIVDSERLGRWFGTWTGDPADGWVMVTMTAEAEPVPAQRYTIDSCRPPEQLALSATDDHGDWHLAVDLAEAEGTTTLRFHQHELEPGMQEHTGPGWEWYLDRLVAAVAGHALPTLADFDTEYLPLSAAYAAMSD